MGSKEPQLPPENSPGRPLSPPPPPPTAPLELLDAAEKALEFYDEYLYQDGQFGDELTYLRKAVQNARKHHPRKDK